MKPAQLSQECLNAIDGFRAAGGVVEFFAFDCESGGESAHLEATLAAHAQLCEGEQLRSKPLIEQWISREEFIGYVETVRRKHRTPGDYFRTRADKSILEFNATAGLLYAFSHPPYSLHPKSPEQADDWWVAISAELLQGDRIALWKTDWSSYFDAGLEWWGAHWWTIHNNATNTIVVVAASATD